MYDERPGGIKMPLLKSDGTIVRQKEWNENRAKFESQLRRTRTSQGD